ncbi:MAG: 6,7-dimethyl-8-ribityllumazine synthase [Bacteroidaceae bacterium]|nr:6,7-dimethyl-8-ribityllumazine synthase [Bacteroidaceae bacterium]
MSAKGFSGISLPSDAAKGHRFCIIRTEWNAEITETLSDRVKETLINYGATTDSIEEIIVPGAFELIYASAQAAKHMPNATIIAIGCVVRGGTPHFDYICQGVTAGLTQINTTSPSAVINGVLTVNEYTQAQDRCGKTEDKGYEFALTAIKMARLKAERF